MRIPLTSSCLYNAIRSIVFYSGIIVLGSHTRIHPNDKEEEEKGLQNFNLGFKLQIRHLLMIVVTRDYFASQQSKYLLLTIFLVILSLVRLSSGEAFDATLLLQVVVVGL